MKSICGRICENCRLYLSCQGCSLCEMPFCRKDCGRCFSLCPNKSAAFAHLKSVGGGELRLSKNNRILLPELVPVLPDRMSDDFTFNFDVIAIHGANFFTSNGENVARVYRQKGLQEALNLRNPVEGVLEFYVKDRTLEGFWDNRKEIYRQLKEYPWRAIISPNFSVYEDAPRIDHLYNIKRSSIVYNEMLEAGLPAVPDISWFNVVDLQQWINEINRLTIPTIAFSFQVVGTGRRAANTYIHYATGFQHLMKNISKDVSVIIAGIASPKRLEMIAPVQHFSVLNQAAYVHSRRGQLSETGKRAGEELSKNDIYLKNLKFYDREYRRIQNAKEEK